MTILELLTIIKRKWYVVLIISLLCAGGTAAYCWLLMEDQYTASVDLYVLTKANDANNDQQVTQSDMTASQQLANDIAVLAASEKVKRDTANALGMFSLDGYKIAVKSSSTNRVITLSVTGQQPAATAVVTNELARQLSATATTIMELRAVNIIDLAEVPTEPSGPNRLLYTGIAFLIGLIVSIILVVAMDLFNLTMRTPEEVEEQLGVPVIGRLPKVKR